MDTPRRCVVVVPLGGLGNQLFQYAAAAATAAEAGPGTEFWVTEPQKNTHSERNYAPLLFRRARAVGPDASPPRTAPYYRVCPAGPFGAWSPAEALGYDHVLFEGNYYQYLPAIHPMLPTLRQELLAPFEAVRASLAAQYQIRPAETAFLHVRRGDYLALPTVHWAQEPEYYREALAILAKEAPAVKRLLLFSDDPTWCAEQLVFQVCEIVQESDEMMTLLMMSLCRGGAIIANSTFSWWGAVLGAEAAGAIVVYPRRWLGRETPNLFPSHWRAAGPLLP